MFNVFGCLFIQDKKEQLNAKTVQLEKQQKSKQKLDSENHQLKRKLEVMKNMEDEFLKTVGNLHTNLTEKEQSLQELQGYCQSVITKERQSNDELQKARKVMIEVSVLDLFKDVFVSIRSSFLLLLEFFSYDWWIITILVM